MFLGLPSCAKIGCEIPAMFKFETEEDGSPITVFLCFIHVLEIRSCTEEMAAVRKEDRRLLEERVKAPPHLLE